MKYLAVRSALLTPTRLSLKIYLSATQVTKCMIQLRVYNCITINRVSETGYSQPFRARSVHQYTYLKPLQQMHLFDPEIQPQTYV